MLRPLVALAFAGFLAASALGLAQAPLALWPDGSGHVHSDPAQHAPLGFGMTLLGHVNVGQSIGEVDVKTDAAGKTWVLAAMLSGGFALIDGTDPANPVLVKKVQAISAYGADAKLSDDASVVYLGLNSGGGSCDISTLPAVPMVPQKRPCGIQVWDATVKDNPQFLGHLVTSSAGSHMIDYEVLNGMPTLAGVSGYNSAPPGMIAVAPLDRLAVGVGALDAGSMHDVTLTMDPQQPGRALALTADGYRNSITVWDITNPADPVSLGTWRDPNLDYVHTVHMTVIEGKRVIAASEECFLGAAQVCNVWFIDASDYGNMATLGKWGNPDARASGGCCRWSTHNFEFADGKLFLGHYHGGVVVLDVSTLADLANPPMLGNFLASKPRVGGSFSSDVPYTWDAVPHDGVVWASDVNTGVYALRLDA